MNTSSLFGGVTFITLGHNNNSVGAKGYQPRPSVF